MSARKYVDIWCDECGNWNDASGLSHNARDARIEARKHGWTVGLPGGRDLCPRCAALSSEDATRPTGDKA